MSSGASYGIIFDVDGVIADSESVNASASIRVFHDLLGIEGVTRADFRDGLGRGAAEYVKAAARVHGRTLTDEEISLATQMRQEYFISELETNPIEPFPGVMELINEALNEPAFLLAIATSSTREKSSAVLRSAGVPVDKMEYLCGDDVTRKKPDPELFTKVIDRLKLPATSCVVIEDAPNGVQAAHAAGCKCISVTNSASRQELADADIVVDTLTEVNLLSIRRLLEK